MLPTSAITASRGGGTTALTVLLLLLFVRTLAILLWVHGDKSATESVVVERMRASERDGGDCGQVRWLRGIGAVDGGSGSGSGRGAVEAQPLGLRLAGSFCSLCLPFHCCRFWLAPFPSTAQFVFCSYFAGPPPFCGTACVPDHESGVCFFRLLPFLSGTFFLALSCKGWESRDKY